MCMPNFDEISQSTAELKLLPVSENGRLLYWYSTPGFDFYLIFVIRMLFCIIDLSNFSKLNHRRRSYDVISIFKMAAASHIGFDLYVMFDHLQIAIIVDLSLVLKFGLDRTCI